MELIERYIYAVTKSLPQSQREDIAQELRGLIEDMIEERNNDMELSKKEQVEDVLLELGNPVELASRYRGTNRYLIGPTLIDPYRMILRIVMFAILIAMSVVFLIESIILPQSLLDHVLSFLISLINASAQAFAWITLGFAIAQYKGVKPENLIKESHGNWKPSDLPPIPKHRKEIKRGEAITGIVFSVIALVFVIFSNHLFGIPVILNGEFLTIIPILNQEKFSSILPLIYVLVAIGILKECIKLIIGKWTKKLALYNLLLNGVTLVMLTFLFRDPTIWNPHFMEELARLTMLTQSEDFVTINKIWEQSTYWIVALFFITLIIDTISVFYRAYKH